MQHLEKLASFLCAVWCSLDAPTQECLLTQPEAWRLAASFLFVLSLVVSSAVTWLVTLFVSCTGTVTSWSVLCAQVQPFQQTAELLEDVNSLKTLHYDSKTGQFLDYGNHSEAMQLQPVVYRIPQGLVRGPLQRRLMDPSQTPRLQLVPHFG